MEKVLIGVINSIVEPRLSYTYFVKTSSENIDQKVGLDSEGLAWLIEGRAGYKFLFSPKKAKSLYLAPQIGIINGLLFK